MNTNTTFFSNFVTHSNELATAGASRLAKTHSTAYVVSEYFVSTPSVAAKSKIDYLESPTQQIRTQLNNWLASIGDDIKIECDDATWNLAPIAKITKEFFDSYEPFFQAIVVYRMRSNSRQTDPFNARTEMQANAALLGMAKLMAWLVPAPSPMILEDGTIGGYWRRGQNYVSIDFEEDGEHSWGGTDGKRFFSGTWTLPGSPLPPVLVNKLMLIAS